MLSVACREGISIKPPVLDLIINAANNDIRQVLENKSCVLCDSLRYAQFR